MENIKLKFSSYLVITVFLTFGLSLSLQSLLAAWQAPSDLPPLSNINPPIFDVSTDTTFHVTSKPLGVTGNLTVNGNQFVTGNVGIGISSPRSSLEIVGGGIRLNGDYGIGFRGTEPNNGNSSGTNDGARIYTSNTITDNTNRNFLVIEATDGNDADPDAGVVFTNKGSDDIREVAMIMRGNGNIGIGTTSPNNKLDVIGNERVTGNLIVGGNLSVTGTTDLKLQCTRVTCAAPGGSNCTAHCSSGDTLTGGGIRTTGDQEVYWFHSYPAPGLEAWTCGLDDFPSTCYAICCHIK